MTALAAPVGAVDVDWGAFGVVFAVTFVAAVGVVVLFAVGLRLLAAGSPDDSGPEGDEVSAPAGSRPAAATAGAATCFVVAAASVLVGIWLIIPQLH